MGFNHQQRGGKHRIILAVLALLLASPLYARDYKSTSLMSSDDSLQGWNGEVSQCSDDNLKACLEKTGPADYSVKKIWYPIVQLGAGAVFSNHVGQSKSFPIFNPTTDEFFNYTADAPSQTGAIFEMFLGTEWKFNPHWALQAGADYDQVYTIYRSNGTFVQGADALSSDTYNYHYRAVIRQLMAEAKLLYNYHDQCHPYLLLGLGAAFNTAYGFNTDVPPTLTFTRTYNDNTNTAFTYALGFGIDFDITSEIRLGAGYRFSDLGKVELGQASIGSTSVSGSLSQTHLYSNIVLGQITFIF